MDEKQYLIKQYENEIEKIRRIKEDLNGIGNLTDDQLIALVSKAQKLDKIMDQCWQQICGNEISREEVRPLFLHREELKDDFAQVRQMEKEISDLKKQIKSLEEETIENDIEEKETRKELKNKMVLMISFGVMFVCSLCFHLIMLKIYHAILIPAFLLMTFIPLGLCIFYGLSLKNASFDQETAINENEELIEQLYDALTEKKKERELLDQKYNHVFEELDEFQMDAYPYVEQILSKMEYRENYQKTRNEYCGVLEILKFKEPGSYLFIPEIFLVEKEMNGFYDSIQEKMRKLDEYLVETIETA